jgi:GDP-4-dehydro-6-deoxy-D-mannose reductase
VRALVTGASGFVGRHLTSALLASGWGVVGVGRKYPNVADSSSAAFQMLTGDVTDGDFLQALFRSQPVDAIFHLAGLNSFSKAPELYRINVVGTATLLEAARDLGKPDLKIVLLGSSAQYGAAQSDPIREENAFNPITHYGISKVVCDTMGRMLFEQTGQYVARARAFNIIGPGQSEELLQGAVIEQIVAIESGRCPAVVEVGNLSTYRDFIDVRDVASGLIAIAAHGDAGDAYNICSGCATKVGELVERLVGLSKVPIKIKSCGTQWASRDVPYQRGSYEKLQVKAKWAPALALEKSLDDALNERRQCVAPIAAYAGINIAV